MNLKGYHKRNLELQETRLVLDSLLFRASIEMLPGYVVVE